jgi:hypothetical protein
VYQAWWLQQGPQLVDAYQQLLLEPNHWLATWRLNSLLVAQHEQVRPLQPGQHSKTQQHSPAARRGRHDV